MGITWREVSIQRLWWQMTGAGRKQGWKQNEWDLLLAHHQETEDEGLSQSNNSENG